MEIAPIPGIRSIIANRTPRADSDLSPAFDIDALSKMGNNAAATRVNKAAGAEEEDDELDIGEDEEGTQDSPSVNYFA
jgi:hypothetical protein